MTPDEPGRAEECRVVRDPTIGFALCDTHHCVFLLDDPCPFRLVPEPTP